jgi:hypothetical protein
MGLRVPLNIIYERETMLYEVVLQQRYFNQICINRWNYVGTGTPAAISMSLALLSAMGMIPDDGIFPSGTILDQMRAVQSTSLVYLQVSARAIYDVEDFYETPFVQPQTGEAGGEASPPFLASALFTNRVRQDIGRGFKRFAGLTESNVSAGGVLDSGMVAALNVLGGLMSDVITYDDEGNTLSFAPVVVQKEKYLSHSDPDRYAYRYYVSEATQDDHIASGINWSAYDTARSQTSRQYGRGQ